MARRVTPRRPTARRGTTRRARTSPARPPVPGPTSPRVVDGDRAAALAGLARLYAELPDLACKGLCGDSCHQHVDASTAERHQLLELYGIDLDAPTPDGACTALTRTLTGAGSCTVHPDRPMICRLWGLAHPRARRDGPQCLITSPPGDRARHHGEVNFLPCS